MSKITLQNIANLDSPTAIAQINANSATIQSAFDNTLSRDGTSPNVMSSNFDMNSFQIINLPAPVSLSSPLRLTDLNSFIGGGTITGIPTGGTTGQVLAKNSGTNYDIGWADTSTDLVAGNSIVLTGTTPVTIALSATPALGTPVSGVLTNCTGTASGLTTGHVTTNANLTGDVTSVGNASTLATVNGNVGSFGSATAAPSFTVNGKGLITAAASATITPAIGSITGLATGVATFLATPTSANLLAALTTKTGTVSAVFSTSPTLVTPVLGAATATSLAFSPTTGGILGSTAGDSASAGVVGEFISSSIVIGSAVALTTSVIANVTSISLTAGDWDITGSVWFNPGTTTSVTRYGGGTSTTSSTLTNTPLTDFITSSAAFIPGASANIGNPLPTFRVTISGTTSYFLNAVAVFTVSTLGGYGYIRARRVR